MPSVLCGFVCTSQHHHFLGFQGLRLKPFWNIKEATGPKGKNMPPSSGLSLTPEANVIRLLSPSSHGKHFRSSGMSWPQILGAHLSPYPAFLKDLDFDHSSLFHTLSPWFPEQNLVLTCALFFPKSSSELLGTSLPTCPSHISRLQGDKWNPQRFTLCPLWVDSWRLCFDYYLHFEDCIHSYREWAITLRSPWPPFFLHLQHSQGPVIYFLHQMFWVFFPSILSAASFVQAPVIPPLNSSHWSPASFPCWL